MSEKFLTGRIFLSTDHEADRSIREMRKRLDELRKQTPIDVLQLQDRGRVKRRLGWMFEEFDRKRRATIDIMSKDRDIATIFFINICRQGEADAAVRQDIASSLGDPEAEILFKTMLLEGVSGSRIFVSFSREMVRDWVSARYHDFLLNAWRNVFPDLERIVLEHRSSRSAVSSIECRALYAASLHPAEAPDRPLLCRVKWFDVIRGFGSIEPEDGSGEILLTVTLVRMHGISRVRRGVLMRCHVAWRSKVRSVVAILDIDESTALPEIDGVRPQDVPKEGALSAQSWQRAMVKWFNRLRGFGFLMLEDGAADVFVHMETVRQSGLSGLQSGQIVQVRVVRRPRGAVAAEMRPDIRDRTHVH